MIITELISKYRVKIAGRIIACFLQTIVLLFFGIMVGGAVTPGHVLIFGLSWTIIIIVIGLSVKLRGCHDESKTIELPWEASTHSSTQMVQPLLIAFAIDEIVMGCATSIIKGHSYIGIIRDLKLLDNVEADILCTKLAKSANAGVRFVDASSVSSNQTLLSILIKCGVVWKTLKMGQEKIGINRSYDAKFG